jgi:hypothetical protein
MAKAHIKNEGGVAPYFLTGMAGDRASDLMTINDPSKTLTLSDSSGLSSCALIAREIVPSSPLLRHLPILPFQNVDPLLFNESGDDA